MYLQLAESSLSQDSTLAERAPHEMFIFVPRGYRGAPKDMYLREDQLDDLDDFTYNRLLNELDCLQNHGLSSKEDRKERRMRRKDRKEEKEIIALDKKASRGGGARRAAKQERVATRQAAKSERKGKGGGGFDKFLDTAKGIVGDLTGSKGGQLDTSITGTIGGSFGTDSGDTPQPTFMQKYKWPLIIGGVVVAGGIVYAISKKK